MYPGISIAKCTIIDITDAVKDKDSLDCASRAFLTWLCPETAGALLFDCTSSSLLIIARED